MYVSEAGSAAAAEAASDRAGESKDKAIRDPSSSGGGIFTLRGSLHQCLPHEYTKTVGAVMQA